MTICSIFGTNGTKYWTDLFVVIVVAVDFAALSAVAAAVALVADAASVAFAMFPAHFGSLL